jgi:hypothetical protein
LRAAVDEIAGKHNFARGVLFDSRERGHQEIEPAMKVRDHIRLNTPLKNRPLDAGNRT